MRTLPFSLSRRHLCLGTLAAGLSGCSRQDEAGPPTLLPAASTSNTSSEADLQVQAQLLPGLIDAADRGPFIDLVHAMDEVYPAGRFHISVSPTGRVMDSVGRGTADLGLPAIRLHPTADADLPYRYSTASYGMVSFVLYSRKDQPITRAMIDQAVAKGSFGYHVEAPIFDWGFPVEPFSTFDGALKKVAAGRIDGFLWAQEEADLALRQLGLQNIHREFYGAFEDVFLIPRSPRGDMVDRIVTQTLDSLRKSNRLTTLYGKIHQPYNPWQP